MNKNGNNRPYRERRKRENRGMVPGRIPKKPRGRSHSNSSDDQREEEGAVPEEELLDPVAEARKALEMFEEVSGEAVVHSIPKKNTIIKKEMGLRNDEQIYLSNKRHSGQFTTNHRSTNGSTVRMIQERRKTKGDPEDAARNKKREEEKAEERRKIEEEKARQKKRIEVGEARRREFRPKIAGLQDSNCLL